MGHFITSMEPQDLFMYLKIFVHCNSSIIQVVLKLKSNVDSFTGLQMSCQVLYVLYISVLVFSITACMLLDL